MSDLKLFEYQHKRVRSTTIDGQIWFVAKDVCDILEIVNVADAMNRLSDGQKRVIGVTDTIGRTQQSYVINESGVYKLVFRSNKPEAEQFMDWLANEVIPQIRKTGKYVRHQQGVLALSEHTEVTTQKEMSKSVNAHHHALGGQDAIIKYNVASCKAHTNKTPVQVKAFGKRQGLKSKDRNSAKEVLRQLEPESACSMSLADNLVSEGHDQDRVFEVTRKAKDVFKGMLELGATPKELDQK